MTFWECVNSQNAEFDEEKCYTSGGEMIERDEFEDDEYNRYEYGYDDEYEALDDMGFEECDFYYDDYEGPPDEDDAGFDERWENHYDRD